MHEYQPFTPEEIAEVRRYFMVLDSRYRPLLELEADQIQLGIYGYNLSLWKLQPNADRYHRYRAYDEVYEDTRDARDIGVAARWLVERYLKLLFLEDWDTPTKRGEDE